ncbi:MAG: ABC transporter permease [Bacillota bacterium]
MKYILSIALRNLRRHKLRTLLSISAIIIAVVIGIFYRSILLGYTESTINNYIHMQTGHVRLVDQEYARRERVLSLFHPVDGFTGEGVSEMIGTLEKEDQIAGALPRIKFGASYPREEEMTHMLGLGIDTNKESEFTDFHNQLNQGRMPTSDNREIAIGSGLLAELDYEVGDRITFIYTTSFNSLQGSTFTITGEIKTNVSHFDNNIFLIPLNQAQEILDMPEQATELLLFTQDREDDRELIGQVNSILKARGGAEKYQLSSWRDAGGIIQWLLAYQRIILFVMAGIVFLASLVIINTLIMVIKERTREIGTMAALGLSGREIILLFTAEGAFMGILGSLIGSIIGGTLTAYTSQVGIDFGEVMEAMGDSLINTVVYPTFSLENLLVAFLVGVIVSTLACVIPARRAAQVEPYEAMRDL